MKPKYVIEENNYSAAYSKDIFGINYIRSTVFTRSNPFGLTIERYYVSFTPSYISRGIHHCFLNINGKSGATMFLADEEYYI